VAVVPLRIARGIQNKLLEAMAMGQSVVATTAAFEGIQATRDADLLIADDPAGFAGAVLSLLRDEDLRTRMGQAARACVESNYTWEDQLAKLDQVLSLVTTSKSAVSTVAAC
jgi:glycosyltransferase involved in cell wall biosynthesis